MIIMGIKETWRIEAARLRDTKWVKSLMDRNIESTPDFYKERMRLLDEFFAEHSEPVDIAIILYGALSDAHHTDRDDSRIIHRACGKPEDSRNKDVQISVFFAHDH